MEYDEETLDLLLESLLGDRLDELDDKQRRAARVKLTKMLAEANLVPSRRAETEDVIGGFTSTTNESILNLYRALNKPGKVTHEKELEEWLKTIRAVEERITGLNPDEASVYSFESPPHLLYSAVNTSVEQLDIGNLLIDGAGDALIQYKLMGRREKIKWMALAVLHSAASVPRLGASYLWSRLIFKYFLDELSRRILGQYDAIGEMKISAGKIRLAAPNIRRVAKEEHMNLLELIYYVLIHEEVHNTQFANFDILPAQKDSLRNYFCDFFRGKGLQTEAMEALMIAVEGYAEFFANKIAQELLPDFKFERKKPTLKRRIKDRILGLTSTRERYVKGEKFISHLYEKGGSKLTNMALEYPPDCMREIENPDEYITSILELQESQ